VDSLEEVHTVVEEDGTLDTVRVVVVVGMIMPDNRRKLLMKSLTKLDFSI
jgi:hypothetical protein